MEVNEADLELFLEYIKCKYPGADITRFGNGFANFHMQSLWELFLHLTVPKKMPEINQGDFDRIFKSES